jgi:hypothetical protein
LKQKTGDLPKNQKTLIEVKAVRNVKVHYTDRARRNDMQYFLLIVTLMTMAFAATAIGSQKVSETKNSCFWWGMFLVYGTPF